MRKILAIVGALLILGAVVVAVLQNQKMEQAYDAIPNSETATSTASVQNDLAGSWRWESSVDASGRTIAPENPDEFILTFSGDGRLSSSTDCNRLAGSYVRYEEVISIGPIVSTEMACQGITHEAVYAGQLAMASSHVIDGDTLQIILVKDAGVMTFTRNNIHNNEE